MRVLILSVILACATAAPQTDILGVLPVVPAVIPTISPGDLQAAAIDAQVQAEDQARALADQARAVADQAKLAEDLNKMQAELALENQKAAVEEVNSAVKEKSEDQFWNVEDKKWQAVDAVKTAEAKIDGAVASNAEAIAKSLTIPVISPINPVLPYGPVIYAPGLIPLAQPEMKDEKLVKTADPDNKAEETEMKGKVEQPNLGGLPQLGGLALASAPLIGAPWVQAPIAFYQPGLLGAPLPLQPVLTPTVVKSW